MFPVFIGACGNVYRADGPPIAASQYQPIEGDVLFQSVPHNELVDMIEGATRSPFSHCGIVVARGDAWYVIEAIGPVRETPIAEWIAHGRGGQMWAYRLVPSYAPQIPRFVEAAQAYAGRPYDFRYRMDDSAIYCSELVYKAFRAATGEELGAPLPLGSLEWSAFEKTIRMLEGGGLPLDREIITPRDVARARQLRPVVPAQSSEAPKPSSKH